MNIGFDAKRFFHNKTGLGNYSRDLIRILAKFYPDNSYFLYNPKPKKINQVFIDGQILIEKKYSGLRLFAPFWRLKFILTNLKKNKIEIYHGLSGEIPLGINKTSIKSIVTIHDLIFLRYPKLYSFIDRTIYRWKFEYASNNSDLIVAISEQTKEDIVTFFKINPEKIRVIYQGCAPEFKIEKNSEILENIRLKYNLPQDFLLNVGTIEERKNIFSIIKAIKNTTIPLVIVGKKTDYYSQIEEFIIAEKMQNQIIVLNGISLYDLSCLYQMAKIFVYPSIFEGFGIPIIEALYSKTPVITSSGSCFAEAGGKNSIYLENYNEDDVLKIIVDLWKNEQLQEEMKEKGFDFVQKFNDENLAKTWIDTYNQVLN